MMLSRPEHQYKENKKLIKELEEENVKIIIPKDKMHMKVAIFDNKFLLMGSMNWTKESFKEAKDVIFKININPFLKNNNL